jgi:hypothetical protein
MVRKLKTKFLIHLLYGPDLVPTDYYHFWTIKKHYMEADVDTKGVWKPAIRSNGKCNSQREHYEHKETGDKDFTERGEVPVYECVYSNDYSDDINKNN